MYNVTSYCSSTPAGVMVLALQFILADRVSPFTGEFSGHTAIVIGCDKVGELLQLLVNSLLISSEDTVSYIMYIGGKN